MKFAAIKRQCLLWGYTSAALVLLLIVGVAVSIWVEFAASSGDRFTGRELAVGLVARWYL